MKKLLFTLVLALINTSISSAQIEVTLEFQNLTDKTFTSGELFVLELNQKIVVSKESFKIMVPSKGNYHFTFKSDDFTAYTLYPERVTDGNNTITIILMEKRDPKSADGYAFPIYSNTNLTDEQIEKRISEGTLNFIIHGIDSSIPKEYVIFKEKYGIGLTKENCALDPFSFQNATSNNQMIADFLNRKYGDAWKNALKSKPLGIK